MEHGPPRAAARAQAVTGRALRLSGRLAEAREQLTAAAEILRADPENDTVRALTELGTLEVFAGSDDADRLTAEALFLGQALDVDTAQLCDLFLARAIYLNFRGQRLLEGVAYCREAVRLATQAGDNFRLGVVLLNLSDPLVVIAPGSAVEAARTAAGHLRQAGARRFLARCHYQPGPGAADARRLGCR